MSNSKGTGLTLKSEHIWTLALTVFFTINMNYDWHSIRLVWYGCLLFVAAAYFVAYGGKFPLYFSPYIKWFLSFVGLGIVSFLWCLSYAVVVDIIKIYIIIIFVLMLIQFSISYGYKVNTMLAVYFIATAINTIYVLMTIDMEKLGDVQLGTYLIDGWNGNGIGFMTAQGAFIGCYLFGQSKSLLSKIIYASGIVAFSLVTMYTGSRTAFIMLVLGYAMFFWLSNPTKIVKNLIITAFVLYGAFYLMMNVESFYNVLGVRMEGLFSLFSGEGEVDSSADIRDTFIENGKRWFAESPVLGYGLNNYKVLNRGATGSFTYSHNTFIELAVDLGVIGLVWYYSAYVYLAIRFLKIKNRSKLHIYLFTVFIASVISQYGTVSYYGFYQNFLLLLCFYAVNQTKDERVKSI